jgi:hypothetical protein
LQLVFAAFSEGYARRRRINDFIPTTQKLLIRIAFPTVFHVGNAAKYTLTVAPFNIRLGQPMLPWERHRRSRTTIAAKNQLSVAIKIG